MNADDVTFETYRQTPYMFSIGRFAGVIIILVQRSSTLHSLLQKISFSCSISTEKFIKSSHIFQFSTPKRLSMIVSLQLFALNTFSSFLPNTSIYIRRGSMKMDCLSLLPYPFTCINILLYQLLVYFL